MLNKVILHGRLTRDPESFATQSGTSFCKFSLANNRRMKDREEAYFAECLAFGKLAETCLRYLRKGSEAIIVGKISTSKWQDKTGQERSKDVITLDEMEFVGGGGGGQQQHRPQYQQRQYQQPPQYQQPQYQQQAAQAPGFAQNGGQQQGFQQPQPDAQGDQQAMPEGDAGDDIPF